VVVFDQQGRPLWRSNRAREVVECSDTTSHPLSLSLRSEARKLALMAQRERNGCSSRMGLELPHSGGPSIASADLMIARGAGGNTYVVARLRERKPDAVKLGMLAEHYDLTPTETAVLGQIAEGLSNREIAERQRVSLETARTHVHRVLQKLGVPTRTKAALLTREG
jgi:DNA-binding CsgD family transcriptional regulator